MKKFNNLIFITKVFLSLIIISFFFLPMKTKAQNLPSLAFIAKKVLQVTYPETNYTVSIKQTVNESLKSQQTKVKKEIIFDGRYNPSTGIKAQRIQEKNNPNFNTKSTNSAIGDVRVIVDVGQFFRKIDKLEGAKVNSVTLNHKKNYLVSAKTGRLSFKIWVNATNFYVIRAQIYFNTQKFAEILIYNKKVNNKYWLPDKIILTQYPENTQIIQVFGSYIF